MTGNRRVTFALVLGVLTMLSMPALAHHGNAAYDDKIILAYGSELHDTQLGGVAGGKTRYNPDADVKK